MKYKGKHKKIEQDTNVNSKKMKMCESSLENMKIKDVMDLSSESESDFDLVQNVADDRDDGDEVGEVDLKEFDGLINKYLR